ncbi:MAG: MAPEG family protein [Bradyrhizobium sp.]
MTTELTLLALTVLLGFVQIVLAAHAKSAQYGYRWNLGARDESMPPLDPVPGRLDRALKNLIETFPFFAAAVLIAHVAGRDGALTWWGAQLYFWARVAYVPAYAAGVPLLRTMVWNVAAIGIGLILIALI